MFNANSFSRAQDTYIQEFNRVVQLMIFCYPIMKQKEIFEYKETFMRNILVKKYLRKYKKDFKIGYLGFEIEAGEIDEDNETIGFIDIKVVNVGKKDLLDEEEYYCFECKRLDGYSSLTNSYIQAGICRFIIGKYSSSMPLAGMIGFVQNGKIEAIVSDINNRLSNPKQSYRIETLKLPTSFKAEKHFKYSYHSIHKRQNNLPQISLYHIMFDFSQTDK